MGTVYLRNTAAPDGTYQNLGRRLTYAEMDNNFKLFLRNDVADQITAQLSTPAGINMQTNGIFFTGFGSGYQSYISSPGSGYLTIYWSTATPYRFAFQSDRNVVLYSNTTSLWSTNTQTSDVRLKENIQPLTNGIEKTKLLNPITYKWKVDTELNDNGIVHEGFIAQEAINVVPDAVKLIGDNYILHKEEMLPILIKALQEAISKIEQLEAILESRGI